MNLRDVKKDIEYVLSAFVDDCYFLAACNPDISDEGLSNLLDEAIDLFNDLKDKVNLSGEMDTAEIFAASDNTIKKDALLTLTTLGFAKSAVDKVLDKVTKEKPDASLETVIKLALNYL